MTSFLTAQTLVPYNLVLGDIKQPTNKDIKPLSVSLLDAIPECKGCNADTPVYDGVPMALVGGVYSVNTNVDWQIIVSAPPGLGLEVKGLDKITIDSANGKCNNFCEEETSCSFTITYHITVEGTEASAYTYDLGGTPLTISSDVIIGVDPMGFDIHRLTLETSYIQHPGCGGGVSIPISADNWDLEATSIIDGSTITYMGSLVPATPPAPVYILSISCIKCDDIIL